MEYKYQTKEKYYRATATQIETADGRKVVATIQLQAPAEIEVSIEQNVSDMLKDFATVLSKEKLRWREIKI